MNTQKKVSPASFPGESLAPGGSEYLLLIRNTAWQKDYSSAEVQNLVAKFGAWVDGLRTNGKIKLASPLAHQGKLLEHKHAIIDGPFIESKEAIAGFILFVADSFDEAVAIANDAPCLEYGQTLELRPILSEPPELSQRRS